MKIAGFFSFRYKKIPFVMNGIIPCFLDISFYLKAGIPVISIPVINKWIS